ELQPCGARRYINPAHSTGAIQPNVQIMAVVRYRHSVWFTADPDRAADLPGRWVNRHDTVAQRTGQTADRREQISTHRFKGDVICLDIDASQAHWRSSGNSNNRLRANW